MFSFRGYSLLVMKIPTLKSLGLRSLKRMGDGGIYITGNKQLCYHHTVNWTRLFGSSPRRRQKPLDIKDNHPQELCSEYMLYYKNVYNGLVMDCMNNYSVSLGSGFKGIVHPKIKIVIFYSPPCNSKLILISFFGGTQKNIFCRMLVTKQFGFSSHWQKIQSKSVRTVTAWWASKYLLFGWTIPLILIVPWI